MAKLFSKRNRGNAPELRYSIEDDERRRILHIFEQVGVSKFEVGMEQVVELLLREYGRLDFMDSRTMIGNPSGSYLASGHFLSCGIERALDFVEACFHADAFWGYGGAGRDEYIHSFADQINELFSECGIGFELTRHETYPQIIVKSSQYEHEQIVKPALEFLRDNRFCVANEEMLDAHADFRAGDYEGSITQCGSAFESVLKTICDLKGWPYDPDKDTVSKLIGICRENGLFP